MVRGEAEYADPALERLGQPQKKVDRGRLPGAVRPQQRQDLAGPNLQVETVKGHPLAVGFPDVFELGYDWSLVLCHRMPPL